MPHSCPLHKAKFFNEISAARGSVGQIANLRAEWLSAQPGASPAAARAP
jgi:hypothetical protein